jgi:TolA-binding protein
MSMERKGNKQAACRALAELNARYPNPPAHVKRWETTERRRAGCA